MTSTSMMNPGLQNPYCSAPSSAKKAPKAAACSCTPSSVTTVRPSHRAASTVQESTLLPSKCTVHSPQFPVSHPHLTDTQPFCRRYCCSVMSAAQNSVGAFLIQSPGFLQRSRTNVISCRIQSLTPFFYPIKQFSLGITQCRVITSVQARSQFRSHHRCAHSLLQASFGQHRL